MKRSKSELAGILCGIVTVIALVLSLANSATYGRLFSPKVEASAEAQTLTGIGNGMDGEVSVEVVADSSKIYSVAVLKHNETPGIGTIAVDQIPGDIVAANSILVDAVTGATVTTDAIKEGVRNALESGGLDVSVFEVEPTGGEEVERTPETKDCDIVIVGGGGAGLTAAIQAHQNGADVIVLEMMPMVGGNSLKATGGMNAAGTATQAAAVEELKDQVPGGSRHHRQRCAGVYRGHHERRTSDQ